MTSPNMVNAYTPGAGNLSPQDQDRVARRTGFIEYDLL